MTYPTCQWPGCDRLGDFSRGLCQRCNMRARRSGTLNDFHAPSRVCGFCGEVFTTGPRDGNQYCSTQCQRAGVRHRREALRGERVLGRVCKLCGGPILTSSRSDAAYCSTVCQQASWYSDNRDSLKKRATEWRIANPELRRESHARRRARKSGVSVTATDLQYVRTRDGGSCWICGEPIDPALSNPDPRSESFDHVIPLCRGGEHSPHNLALAHLGCNMSKGVKLPTSYPKWWGDEGVTPDESTDSLVA